MRINQNFLARLRTMGVVEGISTLVLFGIAMPLKYAAGIPLAVTIVGLIHGILFMMLAAMFIKGKSEVPIPTRLVVIGIVAAIIPFGPFLVDGKLSRLAEPNGRLTSL